jgi:hypothetical protein
MGSFDFAQDRMPGVRAIICSFVSEIEPEQPAAQRKNEDEPMLYCPVCSTRLTERKCKLICSQCGYYLSCADYY